MRIGVIVALMVFMLLPSSGAFADSGLVDKFTDAQLVEILKDDGYRAVELLEAGVVFVKIDGYSYVILNNENGDVQTYYALTGVSLSYEDINEWNRTKGLSRAYLDEEHDPTIESDLLADGGLTAKHVTEFFRVFIDSVGSFREFVRVCDKATTLSSPEIK
ncbi:MAG: YbjN domain-containing protein [Desulfuromonadales bacterium]|nr:YbjN domain-containing protein [Desulfuromonadales bacterium]